MSRRFVRGLVGTTLLWAAAGAALGLLLGLGSALYHHPRGGPIDGLTFAFVRQAVVLWAAICAGMGLLFGVILRRIGRASLGVEALPVRRAGASGVAGGVVLALLLLALVAHGVRPPLAVVLAYVAGGAALGGTLATGAVALAQRAPAAFLAAPRTPRLRSPAS